MKKNGFAPVIILIVLLVGTALFFSLKSRDNYFSTIFTFPTPIEKASPAGTALDPYDKTYTSKALGISFKYNSCGYIKEIDNNIYYLQNKNDKLSSGHKIQVLNKLSNISLVEAINNNLLKSYDRKQCFAISSSGLQVPVPKGWDEAVVSYPVDKNTMDENSLPNCSSEYEKTNSARGFWMNRASPSKYLFLDFGQATLGCNGADIDLFSITFLK